MANRNNIYQPVNVSYPGATIQDFLEELNMTQSELSNRMGRPVKTINEILNGKATITPDTAIQLERVLGAPARFWLARQADYDQFKAEQIDREKLRELSEWAKKFPYNEMVKSGWVQSFKRVEDRMHELLKFFGVASPNEWRVKWSNPEAAFRESPAFKKATEATSVWMRKGEQLANSVSCAPYSETKFKLALEQIRNNTSKSLSDFQFQLIKLCADAGVAVVFVPKLKGVTVYGVTRWVSPQKAMIQLSMRKKFEDIFWFTFFHEACHILKHGKRKVFLEENEHDSPEEREADQFARDFLIPEKSWQEFITARSMNSERSIKDYAIQLKISPAIVVGRLQNEKKIPHSHFNKLRRRYVISPNNQITDSEND